MKEPELGFISLQIDEDEGEAECGCRLVRAEENTGDPAVFLCPLHSAAPEMLQALKTILYAAREGAVLPRDAAHAQARAAIAKAEKKP